MTLSQGRSYLAIPGPSVVPDQVLQAMHRAAPNIYEGALVELTHGLVPDLRRVARTQGEVAMYIANGHGAWEAALSNVVAAGERVLCVATGRFGVGWGEMAQALNSFYAWFAALLASFFFYFLFVILEYQCGNKTRF